ncbi:glutamine amidotransferase-related protein [Schaalia vaccimaxillae]|uniref:glutamine amidotransferase-related protein n=1 Tax=Schaalia vaccimaxillae TaxID=183916 RepID=UPI00047C03D2|nr:gamma-glutamyl-gamma-aminobutyrate hydrolase family protein [Schaalia vaccimaxillae]
MSKPFLMLMSRPDGPVRKSESAALPRIAGLREDEVVRVRMEAGELPDIDFAQCSGIIVCGTPWDASGDQTTKSLVQMRAEQWLYALYQRALDEAFPLLGVCYGLGTLNLMLGGAVDTAFGEAIGAIEVRRTPASSGDLLLEGAPQSFHAYVGHHEGVRELGAGLTLLLEGDSAPVQMVRAGECMWATQFHPELDLEGVNVRIDQYGGLYYPEEEARAIRAQTASVDVSYSHLVLSNFVQAFRR